MAVGSTHIVWEAAANNVHDVRRSIPKVRMLTGVYMLQTTKAKFNQYKVEPTCPLCRLEPEDLSHMLLRCPALADTREAPLSDIRGLITRLFGSRLWSSWSRSTLVSVLIDCNNLKPLMQLGVDYDVLLQLEVLSRRYCYRLHSKRLQLHRKLLNWEIFEIFPIVAATTSLIRMKIVYIGIFYEFPGLLSTTFNRYINPGAPIYWRELRQTNKQATAYRDR